MKKLLALLLALCMVMALAACQPADNNPTDNNPTDNSTTENTEDLTPVVDIHAKGEGVMTRDEFLAAEVGDEVTVECFVQGTQSWWNETITIYAQDKDGGYFLYNMACSEDMSKKLVPGTKIRATGTKKDFNGEEEVADGTIEILEGSYIAEAQDATALLGTDGINALRDSLVAFKGMTVVAKTNEAGEEVPFFYKWNDAGVEGDDIYFDVSVNGATYTFTIESYLTADGSDAYEAAQNLKVGDVIDMTGYLYWYEGVQPHIISITPAA